MSKQRKVDYRLVTRDGQAYADTDADFVMCSSDEEIMSLVKSFRHRLQHDSVRE